MKRVPQKKQSRTLTIPLSMGVIVMLVVALRNFIGGPDAPASPTEANQKNEGRTERQTRLWREGFEAGQQQIRDGHPVLDRVAVDQLAAAKFPRDLTSETLWSSGFEQGQLIATVAK